MTTKILLVEDDPQISKSLSMSLSFSGFQVESAESLAEAWGKFLKTSFDVLLLDVNLPDGNGIDLCKRIRDSGSEVPILFLSARTDEETVVKGMNLGGDDYIRKPFGTEELKVRINRLLHRIGPPKEFIEAGPLKMDTENRSATLQGRNLQLGKREFDILSILAKKSGDTISRDNILLLLNEDPEVYDRTIDSHMSHLRRKIREAAGESLQILAVYGVGYKLQWYDAP
jgi:DNA-binding response OmpR family regulator